MSIFMKALKKSPWIFHVNAGACNNCDIEILDCLTPRFDVERFGIKLVGSIKHADAMVISGGVTANTLPRVLELYEQAPKPILVIAIGSCGISGGIFRDAYNMVGPIDHYLDVDVYIPGCPPRPEAIIAGTVKALSKL